MLNPCGVWHLCSQNQPSFWVFSILPFNEPQEQVPSVSNSFLQSSFNMEELVALSIVSSRVYDNDARVLEIYCPTGSRSWIRHCPFMTSYSQVKPWLLIFSKLITTQANKSYFNIKSSHMWQDNKRPFHPHQSTNLLQILRVKKEYTFNLHNCLWIIDH